MRRKKVVRAYSIMEMPRNPVSRVMIGLMATIYTFTYALQAAQAASAAFVGGPGLEPSPLRGVVLISVALLLGVGPFTYTTIQLKMNWNFFLRQFRETDATPITEEHGNQQPIEQAA